METPPGRTKIVDQIKQIMDHAIVVNRRYLDDEQLIRSEQLAVLANSLKDSVSFFNIGDETVDEATKVNKNEEGKNNLRAPAKKKEKPFQKTNISGKGDLINLEREMDLDNYEKF